MTSFLLLTEAFFSIETPTFLYANSILDRECLSVYGARRVENQERRINANRVSALHSVGCNSHSEWIWIRLIRCNENSAKPSGVNRDAGLSGKSYGAHGPI